MNSDTPLPVTVTTTVLRLGYFKFLPLIFVDFAHGGRKLSKGNINIKLNNIVKFK